jgi:glucan-binding YG repeat protein
LAEVEELLESNEYGVELKPDWTENPDTGMDWNGIPVIHDAHYEKFKKEISRLKLQLDIERKSNERLKDELKSKMSKREAKDYGKQLKAQARTDKKRFEDEAIKKYEAMQAKFRYQRTKAQSERKHSSRLRNKINYLDSDKKKAIIKKEGIKDFVHSKFKGRAQRTCLLKNLKKARCDKYDICESLVLRALGRGCYKHLKKTGPVYYPSIATQDRHLNGLMSCRPGYALFF